MGFDVKHAPTSFTSIASRQGFTLLEVMVSIAILGLGLTAILSAQAGSFAAASHARNISVATGLLRCKMTEVEEQIGRLGFQELDQTETGICCEGDDTPNMKCTWKVEKPVLPQGKFGDLKLDAALGGGPAGGLGSLLSGSPAGSGTLPSLGPDAKIGDVAGALGGIMSGAAPSGGSPTPGAPGSPDLGAAAAGGIGGIASMVMGLVYPSLKILFEASTRRVTVTLNWREGKKNYSMEIQQWITNPQNVTGSDDTDDGGAQDKPSSGSGG
jgi:general secretion pathway protein I